MTFTRRSGIILIAWLMVFSASVVLSSETNEHFEASGTEHLQYAPESSASVRHEHGDTERSGDCHPSMDCSVSAIGPQRKDITQTKTASHVKPVTIACVADRFTPVSDPPPPREAV